MTIHSRPYSTAAACERCVFGRGEHREDCLLLSLIRQQKETIERSNMRGFSDPTIMDVETYKEYRRGPYRFLAPDAAPEVPADSEAGSGDDEWGLT